MDDAFAVTRAQQGEAKTAMVMLRTVSLLKVFIKDINWNLKEIRKIQSDKQGVHFRSAKHHLEVDLGTGFSIQYWVQIREFFPYLSQDFLK